MNFLNKKTKLKIIAQLLTTTSIISTIPILNYNIQAHAIESTTVYDESALVKQNIKTVKKANKVTYYLLNNGTVYVSGYNNYGQLGIGNTNNQKEPVKVSTMLNVIDVIGDGDTTYFLKSDGTVWGCGYNNKGQLGLGTTINQQIPFQIDGISNIKAISLNLKTLFMLDTNGTVFGCGYNSSGELGIDNKNKQVSPIETGLTNVEKIYDTGNTGYVIYKKTDGTHWGVGLNTSGQLGIGNISTQNIPVQIEDMSDVKEISCSANSTYVLKNNGTLLATGINTYGQMGNDTQTNVRSFITLDTNVNSVSAGTNYVLYSKYDGTVFGCGYNSDAQLGIGNTTNQKTPVKVPISNVEKVIATESKDSYFIKKDKSLYACGYNYKGELGIGTTGETIIPKKSNVYDVKDITISNDGAFFITNDGDILVCGRDDYGMSFDTSDIESLESSYLGKKSSTTTLVVPYPLFKSNNSSIEIDIAEMYVSIAEAGKTQEGIDEAQSYIDKISNETSKTLYQDRLNKVVVYNKEDKDDTLIYSNIQDSVIGYEAMFSVLKNGDVWATGRNDDGQLGVGDTSDKNNTVKVSIDNVKKIACRIGYSDTHTLFLKDNGTVWACGYNSQGQLGIGTTTNQSIPVIVQNVYNAVDIVIGAETSYVLSSDGTVWAFGGNSKGQIGSNTGISQTRALKVDIDDVKKIIADENGTVIYMKNDGTVWGCGENSSGQLGIGNTTNQETPVQISIDDFKDIKISGKTTYFLKDDGTIWACGANNYSKLGIGSTTSNQAIPIQIPITDVKEFSTDGDSNFYVKNDGTIWASGSGARYGFGNGSTSNLTNVMQLNIDNVSKVRQNGEGTTFFFKNDGTVWTCGGLNSQGQSFLGYRNQNNSNTQNSIYVSNFTQLNLVEDIEDIIFPQDNTTIVIKKDGNMMMTGETGLFYSPSYISEEYMTKWTYSSTSGVGGTTSYQRSAITKPLPILGSSNINSTLKLAIESVEKAEISKLQTDFDYAQGLVTALIDSDDKTALQTRLDVLQILINQIKVTTEAVVKAEMSKIQSDKDSAQTLVTALPECTQKTDLQNRLNSIVCEKSALELATEAVVKAETTKLETDINSAEGLVTTLSDSTEKTDLQNRLNALKEEKLLADATSKVVKAESTKTQSDVDVAQTSIDKLKDGTNKTALQDRLNKIQEEINKDTEIEANLIADATTKVEKAESTVTQSDVDVAQTSIDKLKDGTDKTNLQDRLDAVKQKIKDNEDTSQNVADTTKAVEKAETTKTQEDVDKAQDLIDTLPSSSEKDTLQDRLDKVQEEIDKNKEDEADENLLADATTKVVKAESTVTQADVDIAQSAIDKLKDGDDKTSLQDRLNIVKDVISNVTEATQAVVKAEGTKAQADIDTAQSLVTALPECTQKTNLQNRLDDLNKIVADEKAQADLLADATSKVVKAETTKTQSDVDVAQTAINKLKPSEDKTALQVRLDKVKEEINTQSLIADATEKVEIAEGTKSKVDVSTAQTSVNKLPQGEIRDALQARLDKIKEEIEQKEEQDAYNNLLDDAITKVEKAESSKTDYDIKTAQNAVNKLPQNEDRKSLQDRLDALRTQIEEDKAEEQSLKLATTKVELAEISVNRSNADSYFINAQTEIDKLKSSEGKTALQKRLDTALEKYNNKKNANLINVATQHVRLAEAYKNNKTLGARYKTQAYETVNNLSDCQEKTDFLERLNKLN